MPGKAPLFIDILNHAAVGREGSGILMGFDEASQQRTFRIEFEPDLAKRTFQAAMRIMPILFGASIAYSIEGP